MCRRTPSGHQVQGLSTDQSHLGPVILRALKTVNWMRHSVDVSRWLAHSLGLRSLFQAARVFAHLHVH